MLSVETGQSSAAARPRRPFLTRLLEELSTLDPLALGAVVVLIALGLLNLVAIGRADLAVHQLLAVVAGGFLMLLLRRSRLRRLPLFARACYFLAIGLLVAVLMSGVQVNGARRWLVVGSLVVQPSELAKLGLLLMLADVLGARPLHWLRVVTAFVVAGLPILLTLLQPDLSTATLLGLLTLAALLVARVPLKAIAAALALAAVVAPAAQHLLLPYQTARIQAFLNHAHQTDPSGSGWSLLQSQIAIASGGLWGTVHQPLHSLRALYLPARQTDLAFASLVEQWGLVAGLAALIAAGILIWRLLAATRSARTRSGTLVASGLAVLLGVEVVVSLAGNLGALPLAGVPFPFVSYGGTTAAAHLAALGLVLSTRRDAVRHTLWLPPTWARQSPQIPRLIAAGIGCQLILLSSMTFHIQEADGASLRELGQTQMLRCLRLDAPRGLITDRHLTPLAVNRTVYEVYAVPGLVDRNPGELQLLAPFLGRPPAELSARVKDNRKQLAVKVAEIPVGLARKLDAVGLGTVYVAPSPRRLYPYGPLLGPILGFTGIASPTDMARYRALPMGSVVGKSGLERRYDSLVRGIDGRQCVYVDPAGKPVAMAGRRAPIPGPDLVTSLDLGLQQEVTRLLEQRLCCTRNSHPDLGAAIVLDARTGALLAMASLPAYDNNMFNQPADLGAIARAATAPGYPMLEHATQVAAPPGSTFKLVVGAASSVYDAIPPYQVIPTGYYFTYGGHTFHGWGYLPPQNLPQAIAWSNDIYFYKAALALGPERIHEIGTQLGVGHTTGIDLPGEDPGVLGTPASVEADGGIWYPGMSVILGIGQGYVLATPLQDNLWTAAVSSGVVVTPHFALGYRTGPKAADLTSLDFPIRPLPFADRLGPVQDGMRQAVTRGLDPEVKDLPVPAGAKTGTAEDATTPSNDADSWYTASAPFQGPEVVVTVFARGGGQGFLSGPTVRAIMGFYYDHRGQILAAPAFSPPDQPPPYLGVPASCC